MGMKEHSTILTQAPATWDFSPFCDHMTFHFSSCLSLGLHSDLYLPTPNRWRVPPHHLCLYWAQKMFNKGLLSESASLRLSLVTKEPHFQNGDLSYIVPEQGRTNHPRLQQTQAQFVVSDQLTFYKLAATRKDGSNSVSVGFTSHLWTRNCSSSPASGPSLTQVIELSDPQRLPTPPATLPAYLPQAELQGSITKY